MPTLSRRTLFGLAALPLLPRVAGAEEPVADEPAAPASPASGPAGAPTAPVRCRVDGGALEADVDADTTAAELLRDRGHHGVKVACGGGACGACTVLVNGRAEVTCLLPATALHGAEVTTATGLAGAGGVATMHCVQRAFLAHDALQCGYCTPGFVTAAAAFVDGWRREHGASAPPREVVEAGLAGNLCRCGAYASIRSAVVAACEGRFDAPTVTFERVEGADKVSGRARYPSDVSLPEQLESAVFRSPHAHARLLSLDVGPALAAGAVAALPWLPVGQRARFQGQEVAVVAAPTRRQAEAAARAVVATWDVLPSSPVPEVALREGAALVYDGAGDAKGAPTSAEGLVLPASWKGNVRGPTRFALLARPIAARHALARAALRGEPTHDGTYTTSPQSHTAFETHGAVARWVDGGLEVWASTQSVRPLAEDLADAYDLPRDAVVVHAEHVGGGFGAKVGLAPEHRIAVELSRACGGRPVRRFNDRAEELLVGGFRPGGSIRMEAGLPGDQLALHHTSHGSSGCAVGNATGYVTRVFYQTPLLDIDDYDVLTHDAPGKPMRGPGGPMTMFALESAMDELARTSGQDPLDLRRRFDGNVPRNHLYAWAGDLPVWRDRDRSPPTGRLRRGVGLAAGVWFQLWDPSTQVELEVSADGVVARSSTQDVGNGARTVIAREVAAGLPPGTPLRVELGDSRLVHGPLAGGSRGTSSLAPAAQDAVRRLRRELDALARDRGLPAHAPLSELFRGAPPLRVVGRRPSDEQPPLAPVRILEFLAGRHMSGTVAVAVAEVDSLTGRVRVPEVHVGVGVGRIVAPRLARSQVEGSVVQAVGMALYEARVVDPVTGRLVSRDLDHYHLPGLGDTPEIHVHFAELGFEHVAGGSAGVGEIGGVAVPAAIANAVRHATGRRPTAMPIGPRSLLGGAA